MYSLTIYPVINISNNNVLVDNISSYNISSSNVLIENISNSNVLVDNISNSNVLVGNISSVCWFIETKSDFQTLLTDPQNSYIVFV